MQQPENAPAAPRLEWELDDATAALLRRFIGDDEECQGITLSVGYIKDDDGKVEHGLCVRSTEYPEEGGVLLAPCAPPPHHPDVRVLSDAAARDLRRAGRAEAVATLLKLDPAELDGCVDSSPLGDTGEYQSSWNEAKLRTMFDIASDDPTMALIERIDAAYWEQEVKLDRFRHLRDLRTADLLARFTEVKPCVVEDWPNAHTAWLKVGVQSFCITPAACETKEEAEFMAMQLARALRRILRGDFSEPPPAKTIDTANNSC
jgi:hypothetical protein